MSRITLYIQPSFQLLDHSRCFSGSPFAIKVARVLQYKGLGFNVVEVGWGERDECLPGLSSSRKLPVLDHDDERIEDSTDIACFIEATYPTPQLVPNDPMLRARCHFLEEWADEVLYWYGMYEQRWISDSQMIREAYFADLPKRQRKRASDRWIMSTERKLSAQGIGRYPVDKVKKDVRRGLDGLVALIETGGHVAGEHLSLADLALFAQCHRRLAGTNPWFASEVSGRSVLVDWLRRVDQQTLDGRRLAISTNRRRPR